MNDYEVVLTPRAIRDLEKIYQYIKYEWMDLEAASKVLHTVEEGIYSLYRMPYQGAKRKIGRYADKDYRQLFIGNYTVVYKVLQEQQRVVIVTIRYSPSVF